jgi:hypothetical protein
MKLKSTFSKFIHSRILLYVTFLLSFVTFFGNLIYGNFNAVVYFILVGGLTSFFSRNMIIVLLVPMIITNIYTKFIQPQSHNKEGMENNVAPNSKQSKQPSSEQDKINAIKQNARTNNSSNSLPIVPPPHISPADNNSDMSNNNDETFTNNESKDSNQNKKKKYNIDYASTVEEAYDNLNNIIGSDGMKNLTSDTKRLMQQQVQLTEAMKNIQPLVESMGPLLEKAGGLLNSMGGSENIGNLANLAKNFTASAK